jgi:outer membrane lipoprotein SlyB
MNEMRELTDAELEAVGGAGFWGWVGAIGAGAVVGGAAGSEAGPVGTAIGAVAGGIIGACIYGAYH